MKSRKRTFIKFILLVIMFFTLIAYYYVEVNIKPTLVSICEVKAKVIATQIINDTVREELNKNTLKEQILIPNYDKEGRVNMIRTDAMAMNTISSNIAKNVQQKIVNLENQFFSVPLFTALDNQLLASKGPELKFTILHQGSVLVDFVTEFAESGINQTRYKIYITVDVDICVISPVNTSTTTVGNNVLIAEIVIVGDVPDSYTNFPYLFKEQ
ncbi:MAG: sporulation protein YunB [Sedimentibacter sp.]|uniref:sporulation protein YunB n=1 Tax=Sedimentibacter sp. TaxID=1960295 RepID=UPI0029820FF4|nr:sporulation protein YunB [Sedimentibacter sp.]MDW5298998.1 sporulation protein YunB [Sedimentibacter sp.]